MDSPKKKKQAAADSVGEKLTDEELGKVTGGQRGTNAEEQVNIADLPNVRVDVSPM